MELNICVLDRELVAPFEGYILPMIRERIKTDDDLLILGAVIGGSTVGALVSAENGGSMELLSIFVDEKVRRNGIGSMLLTSACEAWKQFERPVGHIYTEFQAGEEEEEELKGFFESMGFEISENEGPLWSIDCSLLHHVPVLGDAFSPNYKKDEHVHYFSELTKEQLEDIEADASVPYYLKPSALKKILRQPSTVWIENGKVLGWCLGCESFDGGAVLSACCKRKGAPDGSFRKMVTSALNRQYMMLGHDFPIYISTVNDHSTDLVRRLTLGRAKQYGMFVAETGDPAPEWLTELNNTPVETVEEEG